MAVQLSMTQPNGVVSTYNRVSDIRYSPKESLDVMVSSYVSKDARDSGAKSLNDVYVSLDVSQIDSSQSIQDQCYNQLCAAGGMLAGGTQNV